MRKRTYRTSEQWAELFNSYEQSGLTIADYCQENKLSQSYFIVKYRQHKKVSLEASHESGFVKALPPSLPIKSANNLVLNYNGAQLQLPMATDPTWLAQLMKALSACMKMFVEPPAIYLHKSPVDFRKSINGLSVIVEEKRSALTLLAQIITAKDQFGLPLYRQEALFKSFGYAGYHKTQATLVGCCAHARRKFMDAKAVQPKGKTGRADQAFKIDSKTLRC